MVFELSGNGVLEELRATLGWGVAVGWEGVWVRRKGASGVCLGWDVAVGGVWLGVRVASRIVV